MRYNYEDSSARVKRNKQEEEGKIKIMNKTHRMSAVDFVRNTQHNGAVTLAQLKGLDGLMLVPLLP